jgi:hypothetical protein
MAATPFKLILVVLALVLFLVAAYLQPNPPMAGRLTNLGLAALALAMVL